MQVRIVDCGMDRPIPRDLATDHGGERFAHVCLRKLFVLCARGGEAEGPHACTLGIARHALPVLIGRCEAIIGSYVADDAADAFSDGRGGRVSLPRHRLEEMLCVLEVLETMTLDPRVSNWLAEGNDDFPGAFVSCSRRLLSALLVPRLFSDRRLSADSSLHWVVRQHWINSARRWDYIPNLMRTATLMRHPHLSHCILTLLVSSLLRCQAQPCHFTSCRKASRTDSRVRVCVCVVRVFTGHPGIAGILAARRKADGYDQSRERTHLMFLFPALCAAVGVRDARLREYVQRLLLLCGHTLALVPTLPAAGGGGGVVVAQSALPAGGTEAEAEVGEVGAGERMLQLADASSQAVMPPELSSLSLDF